MNCSLELMATHQNYHWVSLDDPVFVLLHHPTSAELQLADRWSYIRSGTSSLWVGMKANWICQFDGDVKLFSKQECVTLRCWGKVINHHKYVPVHFKWLSRLCLSIVVNCITNLCRNPGKSATSFPANISIHPPDVKSFVR